MMNHSARRINAIAQRLDARRYLEIGVSGGTTFRDVTVAERTGVDPSFGFDTSEVENEFTRCVSQASDMFFAAEPMLPGYDIIFIDGLHTFEQVVRDFSNAILHSNHRSAILLDDTLPNSVFSAVPDLQASAKFRKAAGVNDTSWHGDCFKAVFYIHDFWPSLNYRTIVGSGNPQTLVWRSKGARSTPAFNNLETISRLSYFDMLDNSSVLRHAKEDEAIELCITELLSLKD